MPTYTVSSFTASQTPVSEGGDFATAYGSGLNVDGSGNLNSPTGWNSSYIVPAVDSWDRASMFIEADVTFSSGVIGIGFLNDSGSASQSGGLRFHLNGASSALLREYTDASSLEIYTSLSTPTWTGTAQKIGLLLTDSATANTMDYACYVDTGSGFALATTNATGTITMEDAVTTLQPWVAGNNGGNITAMEARDELTSISVTPGDATPEDGVQQSFTTTMTGTITAATLGGYDILSLLSDTDPTTATTYTLDISALPIETNASRPRIGIPIDLTITTTNEAATSASVTIQPKTGWEFVELEDTINKDAGGLINVIETAETITVTNADAAYYDGSNNANVTVNGVYTSDLTTAGEFTKVILQDGGTSPATSYSDNFYPYGEVSGSIIESKLTIGIGIGL